jgi:hypothetical protein
MKYKICINVRNGYRKKLYTKYDKPSYKIGKPTTFKPSFPESLDDILMYDHYSFYDDYTDQVYFPKIDGLDLDEYSDNSIITLIDKKDFSSIAIYKDETKIIEKYFNEIDNQIVVGKTIKKNKAGFEVWQKCEYIQHECEIEINEEFDWNKLTFVAYNWRGKKNLIANKVYYNNKEIDVKIESRGTVDESYIYFYRKGFFESVDYDGFEATDPY